MNNGPDASAAVGMLCFAGVAIAVLALVITIWWKIFEKTGYGGAMSLLMLLPIVNLIMLLVLAFGDWPVLQEVRRLRQDRGDRDYGGGRPSGGERYGGGPPRGLERGDPEAEDDPRFRR